MIVELGAGHRYDVARRATVMGVATPLRGGSAGQALHPPADLVDWFPAGWADAIEVPAPLAPGAPPEAVAGEVGAAVEGIRRHFAGPVAVHATHPEVLAAALDAGAAVAIVTTSSASGDTWAQCARVGAAVVVAHRGAGRPAGVRAELTAAAGAAMAAGLPAERIVLDDGLRLGKSAAEARALLHSIGYLVALGHPTAVTAGPPPAPVDPPPDLPAEHAAEVLALSRGCGVVRSCDPRGARRVAHVVAALLAERADGPSAQPVGPGARR